MLTFFTIPKPFVGHIGIIQRNALRSWRAVHPECQVLVFGDEAGTAEVCTELQLTHIPHVTTTEFGTPLLDAVFREAQALAVHRFVCYANADIIMPPGFGILPSATAQAPFLAVGRRWDLDVTAPLDVGARGWFEELQRDVARRGRMHEPSGSDYFLFRRGDAIGDLLPFAVGRPGWDNWMIYHARELRVPVIDASESWQVIHQNHDYAHVPERRDDSWEGPEADQNRRLLAGNASRFTLRQATHALRGGTVRRRFDRGFLVTIASFGRRVKHAPGRLGRWLFKRPRPGDAVSV